MISTIDAAGRVVIPKALREQAGLVAGAEIRIELDGAGIRIEAAPGRTLEHTGRFLTIPATGRQLDEELVDGLRRDAQR
jgi:AbrB family looped-hinge helix DNA binding protein